MLVFRALALFMSFALRQHHISLASETVYFLFLFPLSISYLNVKKILSLDRDLSEQGGFSYESVYNGPISLPYDTLITLVSCRFLSLSLNNYGLSVVFLSIRDLTQQNGWKTQTGRMKKQFRARPGMHCLTRHFRELTQQDGWNTQDGRMTKQCRSHETVHSQSCVTFFSADLLLRKLPIFGITKVILKETFFLESTHFFMRLYYYRCC